MKRFFFVFIINALFLINPSVGYSQSFWCDEGVIALFPHLSEGYSQSLWCDEDEDEYRDFKDTWESFETNNNEWFFKRFERENLRDFKDTWESFETNNNEWFFKRFGPENYRIGSSALENRRLLRYSKNGNLRRVNSLLRRGVNVNYQNYLGRTALMYASYEGRLDVVRELIKAGADVNLQTNDGMTALMYAGYRGHFEIVEALLEAGATE